MKNISRSQVLRRIEIALSRAATAISPFLHGKPAVEYKSGGDPVTEADRIANGALREALQQQGEGWLSEESADDFSRLTMGRVWIVDPIDGTREFVSGIPEWCISVGFVECGRAVAGGICNPVTGEVFLGALGEGVRRNGSSVSVSHCENLEGMVVLASRSEVAQGEWDHCRDAPFVTRAVGSVAYKLALVASGKADATWTLSPKNEWDVAAGTALVQAAGGIVRNLDGSEILFNSSKPRLPGLLASGPNLHPGLTSWLRERNLASLDDCQMRAHTKANSTRSDKTEPH